MKHIRPKARLFTDEQLVKAIRSTEHLGGSRMQTIANFLGVNRASVKYRLERMYEVPISAKLIHNRVLPKPSQTPKDKKICEAAERVERLRRKLIHALRLVIFSSLIWGTSSVTSHAQTIGLQLSGSKGLSYTSPTIGAFGDVNLKRFKVTTDVRRERKTFSSKGLSASARIFVDTFKGLGVGVSATRTWQTGYHKTAVSPLIGWQGHGVLATFRLPDMTSPNHTWGPSLQYELHKGRMVITTYSDIVLFHQPFTRSEYNATGLVVGIRLGWRIK